jgi:Gas vesicle synthesis protein GvpL/GvpF
MRSDSVAQHEVDVSDHVYVYCAVESSPEALPAVGMPDGAAPRTLPLQRAVSLIVSDVPAALYNASSLEPKLADLDWVAAAGAAHHAVVDALAEAGLVVLPFRLFTIFSDESTALDTFKRALPAMARAFDRVRGRQEWVVRIGKPDPARAPEAPASDAPASTGTGFLRAKADARREALARIRRVQHDALTSFEALAKLADAATSRPVDPAGSLLCDGALLVPPSRVEAVREALARTAEGLLREGCPVSLTGPWPPYSFASMDAAVDG